MRHKRGEVQALALKALREHGAFFAGCGWIWGNWSETVRLMDALVAKHLAVKIIRPNRKMGSVFYGDGKVYYYPVKEGTK